jgi:hypothetical protein
MGLGVCCSCWRYDPYAKKEEDEERFQDAGDAMPGMIS